MNATHTVQKCVSVVNVKSATVKLVTRPNHMAVDVYSQIVSNTTLDTFNKFFKEDDDYLDARPDMHSKSPLLSKDDWPKKNLLDILDQVLQEKYIIDEMYFLKQFNSSAFKIHVDSGKNNDKSKLYKNVIIPLENDSGSTIIFDNHWTGDECVFSRQVVPPFEYTLQINGKQVYVEDMREFKSSDQKLMATVADLIEKRKQRTPRQYDYSKVSNLSDKAFPKEVYDKYLRHIPYENCHGLTLHKTIEWRLGDVYTFDRTHLHTGTSSHDTKSYIVVFTSRQ